MLAAPLRDRLVSSLIGSPLQRPAEYLRKVIQLRRRRQKAPELVELLGETERMDVAMDAIIQPWMNCVDVGGHLGSVLQRIIRLAPQGRHFVIEAIPYKAELLRRKFPGVVVHECAVSNEPGLTSFFVHQRSGFSGLRRAAGGGDAHELRVRCERLEDLIPSDVRVDFLKVDVEGAELQVFQGARRIIERDRPVVLFECARAGLSKFDASPLSMWNALRGYDIFLPRDAVAGPALDFTAFEAAIMVYPYQAFNFFAKPRLAVARSKAA